MTGKIHVDVCNAAATDLSDDDEKEDKVTNASMEIKDWKLPPTVIIYFKICSFQNNFRVNKLFALFRAFKNVYNYMNMFFSLMFSD